MSHQILINTSFAEDELTRHDVFACSGCCALNSETKWFDLKEEEILFVNFYRNF